MEVSYLIECDVSKIAQIRSQLRQRDQSCANALTSTITNVSATTGSPATNGSPATTGSGVTFSVKDIDNSTAKNTCNMCVYLWIICMVLLQ